MKFRIAAALVLFAAALSVAAQPAKIARVGVLYEGPSAARADARIESFERQLRQLGWVEGKNLVTEWRSAEFKPDRLRELATDLVRLKVDVIFTPSTSGARAAQEVTRTIPIVMWTTADPVKVGFMSNRVRPDGNITGLADFVSVSGKLLELLKEFAPSASRIAVLRNPGGAATAGHLDEITQAARTRGVEIQVFDARSADEFDRAFAAMSKQRSEALLIILDPLFLGHRQRIASLAIKHRLPTIYGRREFAEAGGLMSYGADLRNEYRTAARYVDRILRGAKVADLPVEQPTKHALTINLKTAAKLGLSIPNTLFLRADELVD